MGNMGSSTTQLVTGFLQEWEIMRIFVQLVLALNYIHSRKVDGDRWLEGVGRGNVGNHWEPDAKIMVFGWGWFFLFVLNRGLFRHSNSKMVGRNFVHLMKTDIYIYVWYDSVNIIFIWYIYICVWSWSSWTTHGLGFGEGHQKDQIWRLQQDQHGQGKWCSIGG